MIVINNRDYDIDQNNRDYDFGQNRAALVKTIFIYKQDTTLIYSLLPALLECFCLLQLPKTSQI